MLASKRLALFFMFLVTFVSCYPADEHKTILLRPTEEIAIKKSEASQLTFHFFIGENQTTLRSVEYYNLDIPDNTPLPIVQQHLDAYHEVQFSAGGKTYQLREPLAHAEITEDFIGNKVTLVEHKMVENVAPSFHFF